MIEKIEAVILVNTPTSNIIPPINSARAIGSCISGGRPICISQSCQLGSNFFKLWTRNIEPRAARIPQWAMSCNLFSLNIASANMCA